MLDERHPLSHTLPGGHALWPKADVVLAVGTRLQLPLAAWGTDDKLKVIKVDIDREELDRIRKLEIGLVGDAASVLARLTQHLAPHLRRCGRIASPHSRAVKERVAADVSRAGAANRLSARNPRRAARQRRAARRADPGRLRGALRLRNAHCRAPIISSGYQGTLGWVVATALGAKHALGDVPVVAISGDGGFMFNVQELATAVRHRIPIVVVVFNDGAYGNVRNMQKNLHGNRLIGTDLANPDFVRLAESFGIAGHRVGNPEGLRRALEQSLASNEPALIEVPVGEMPSPWPFIDLPKVRGV